MLSPETPLGTPVVSRTEFLQSHLKGSIYWIGYDGAGELRIMLTEIGEKLPASWFVIDRGKASKSVHLEHDPTGRGQHDPGAKNDAGKLFASLLQNFSRALEGVAKVSTYGATKYTRDGWEVVPEGEQRYKDAMWRHLLKAGQEDLDQESGLAHDYHALWNLLAYTELRLRREQSPQKSPADQGSSSDVPDPDVSGAARKGC